MDRFKNELLDYEKRRLYQKTDNCKKLDYAKRKKDNAKDRTMQNIGLCKKKKNKQIKIN